MNRIRTRTRNPIRRAGARIGQACDDHQWIPMAVVAVLLVVVSSTWLN